MKFSDDLQAFLKTEAEKYELADRFHTAIDAMPLEEALVFFRNIKAWSRKDGSPFNRAIACAAVLGIDRIQQDLCPERYAEHPDEDDQEEHDRLAAECGS